MPGAKTSAQHAAVDQTVRDLLEGVSDPRRAAALIADVIAHHAPELRPWAEAQLRARHPWLRLPGSHPSTVAKPPEAQYKALFGVDPVVAAQAPTAPSEASTRAQTTPWRVDPELGRLCIALRLGAQLRIWVVIRQHVREQGGAGWIERATLREALRAQGVACSARHLRRLLAGGEGLFWNVTRERVYMRSWAHLAANLTERALAARIGQAGRNRLGAREMYVSVAGGLEAWEAQLYAAWLAYRNNPTISRSQLADLFGRDATALRRWEQTRLAGQLTVRRNYAQCPDHEAFYDYIPRHATAYAAWVRWKGKPQRIARIRWQLPNTYLAGAIKQHHKRGQAAKVRRRVNAVTERMPADERRGGWHRLYFDQPETLRKFVRKHPEESARYVWRGENRYLHGIFEINTSGFPLTHALERARPRDERAYLMG